MHWTNKRTRLLWYRGLLIALLSSGTIPLDAQAPVERPEVHAEFGVGVSPWSGEAFENLTMEDVLMLISGFHRGWSVDKFIDETEKPRVRILTILDDLERSGLVRGRNDFDMRPAFPVLSEQDLATVGPLLQRSSGEFSQVFEDHWDEVETFANSLEAGHEFSESQNMYRIVVGGILLGGLREALYDDQTLMPNPPRRARRGDAYYAWMVEGAIDHNYLVRQTARVGRHQVFSVGPIAEGNLRIQIDELSKEGPVYETEDARRWRVFSSVFSRDYLLPYVKTLRSDLIDMHSKIEASNYTALAEFVAWYYQELVERTADQLVASGRIEPPETSYKYALREVR